MKKTTMLVLAVLFLVAIAGAETKKVDILKIKKGEMPGDIVNCEISLSEENGEKEGDLTMKMDFKGKGFVGQFKPGKAAWEAFKKVNLAFFNPSDKEVEIGFEIKGAKETNNIDNRKQWKLKLPPGKSKQSIDFTGVTCDDEKSKLDTSKVYIYAFWNFEEKPLTVYLLKFNVGDE